MAHPKRRISRTRAGKRRSHNGLKAINLIPCQHCHELVRAHTVCPFCGYYKEREVMHVEVL